jgi:hypothetical protein
MIHLVLNFLSCFLLQLFVVSTILSMGITLIVFHRKITKIAYHCKTKFSSFGCGQVDISSLRPPFCTRLQSQITKTCLKYRPIK